MVCTRNYSYISMCIRYLMHWRHSRKICSRQPYHSVSWLRTVEWFRVGVGSSKWHRHEKFKHPWVFEQNHSPIPCNELPPRIHQKLKQTDPTPFELIAQESGRVPRWCWIVKMASTRKIQTSGCFEQNHSPIPCNELPPRINQKLKQTDQTPL